MAETKIARMIATPQPVMVSFGRELGKCDVDAAHLVGELLGDRLKLVHTFVRVILSVAGQLIHNTIFGGVRGRLHGWIGRPNGLPPVAQPRL